MTPGWKSTTWAAGTLSGVQSPGWNACPVASSSVWYREKRHSGQQIPPSFLHIFPRQPLVLPCAVCLISFFCCGTPLRTGPGSAEPERALSPLYDGPWTFTEGGLSADAGSLFKTPLSLLGAELPNQGGLGWGRRRGLRFL